MSAVPAPRDLIVSPTGEAVAYSDDPRDVGWVVKNIPCQSACPAATNIPAYIRAIAEGRHGDAYEINRQANVLPGVLGRICSRQCEAGRVTANRLPSAT